MGDNFNRPAHRCVQRKDLTDYEPHPNGGGLVHKSAQIGDNCFIGANARIDEDVIIGNNCKVDGRVCFTAKIGENVVVPRMGIVSQGTHIPANTEKDTVIKQYLCDTMA